MSSQEIKLPKFRCAVIVNFLTFRTHYCENLGGSEVETPIAYECYRVKIQDGDWRWQIKGLNRFPLYCGGLEIEDQEVLDTIGSDANFWEIEPISGVQNDN